MSEQQLKDFGARAETLVEIPDFTELDRRGRDLRVRRRVGVAAVLAAVLAVAGVATARTHRTNADPGPVKPLPPAADASPYPGVTMLNLNQGTYVVQPGWVAGHPSSEFADRPVAELAVPKGWNAWVGPNRFDGHTPSRTNEQALGHMTWYVGALVLKIEAVNTHGCNAPDVGNVSTAEDLVAALRRTFGFKVIRDPEPVHRFGYPATRMRVRVTQAIEDCGNNNEVFDSASAGLIQYEGAGWISDIWVVDVDGFPIYVQKTWSPNAPRTARSQLDSVIDSLRLTYLQRRGRR
jgi:hypothetical protein